MPSGPLFLQKIERAPCILHVAALWNSGASVRLEPAVVYYILRNTSVQSLDHSHIIYFLITYIKQEKNLVIRRRWSDWRCWVVTGF